MQKVFLSKEKTLEYLQEDESIEITSEKLESYSFFANSHTIRGFFKPCWDNEKEDRWKFYIIEMEVTE